jgi:hypothetical protein
VANVKLIRELDLEPYHRNLLTIRPSWAETPAAVVWCDWWLARGAALSACDLQTALHDAVGAAQGRGQLADGLSLVIPAGQLGVAYAEIGWLPAGAAGSRWWLAAGSEPRAWLAVVGATRWSGR